MGASTDSYTIPDIITCPFLYDTTTARHRWELLFLCYHGIRGNYHYPVLGLIVSVILHDFIIKITKTINPKKG